MPVASLFCYFAAPWSYNQGAQVGGVKLWHLERLRFPAQKRGFEPQGDQRKLQNLITLTCGLTRHAKSWYAGFLAGQL